MGIVQESYTAAECAVGVNLAEGKPWQRSSRRRRVVRMGFSGSNALGDGCKISLYYGTEKVATLLSQVAHGGTVVGKEAFYWHTSKLICGRGVPINVMVEVAAATDPVYLQLDIQEL